MLGILLSRDSDPGFAMGSDPVIKLRSDPGPVFKSWTDSDPDLV